MSQGKLTLGANIHYRGNGQDGAQKAQRRNKWTCALKLAMSHLEIYGPLNSGNPIPPTAAPIPWTQVPFSTTTEEDKEAAREKLREEMKAQKKVVDSEDGSGTKVGGESGSGEKVVMEMEADERADKALRSGAKRI